MSRADKRILIYGCYGYTGTLVIEEALHRGLKPILAGRDPRMVVQQAEKYACDYKVFPVDHPRDIDAALDDPRISVVLNIAGPFVPTFRPLVDACMRHGKHYLDITGELPLLEEAHGLDMLARRHGIVLMPATGFDVVPSDCLAARLKQRLPTATHLTLALDMGHMPSHGTIRTFIQHLGTSNFARENGQLIQRAFAHKTRMVPLRSAQLEHVMTVPWGDVSTAYYSTYIPNVEVFFKSSRLLSWAVYASSIKPVRWLLASKPVKSLLMWMVPPKEGPSDLQKQDATPVIWCEARDERTGETATSRLTMADAYTVTANAAVSCAKAVCDDVVPRTGFLTPSMAYGADFILRIPNIDAKIEDLTGPSFAMGLGRDANGTVAHNVMTPTLEATQSRLDATAPAAAATGVTVETTVKRPGALVQNPDAQEILG